MTIAQITPHCPRSKEWRLNLGLDIEEITLPPRMPAPELANSTSPCDRESPLHEIPSTESATVPFDPTAVN